MQSGVFLFFVWRQAVFIHAALVLVMLRLSRAGCEAVSLQGFAAQKVNEGIAKIHPMRMNNSNRVILKALHWAWRPTIIQYTNSDCYTRDKGSVAHWIKGVAHFAGDCCPIAIIEQICGFTKESVNCWQIDHPFVAKSPRDQGSRQFTIDRVSRLAIPRTISYCSFFLVGFFFFPPACPASQVLKLFFRFVIDFCKRLERGAGGIPHWWLFHMDWKSSEKCNETALAIITH